MPATWPNRMDKTRRTLRRALNGPHILAFLPALALGAFWLGGEALLIVVALTLPAFYALVGSFGTIGPDSHRPYDSITGLPLNDTLETTLTAALAKRSNYRRATACFMIAIDDFDVISDRFGRSATDLVLHETAKRLRAALRNGDMAARIGTSSFGVAISPVPVFDTELAVQMATRLQRAIEEPIKLDNTIVYISCSIGFCLGTRSPDATGPALVSATATALSEAMRNAPSAIRAYSEELRKSNRNRHIFADEAAEALENGAICPYFQPQISTDTGQVTGFEALARWKHPERGMISPAEFLPILEASGQLARLGEVMLRQALEALRAWDLAGLNVPTVGVNFSPDELRNPKLVERVTWELDRFELTPDRLSVEVLETVVATSPEDIISRNINGLAEIGCRIDLDDFGTGHASISSIGRFSVQRLKIDRSFVMKVDRDTEQQRMVAAILTMAERLDLETLAEGVETPGEHAMLAQLGCDHVQGFGIARPMPFDQTKDWVKQHSARLATPPRIIRRGP
jgi:diguanylate cyclase (GGDEF)-like protein